MLVVANESGERELDEDGNDDERGDGAKKKHSNLTARNHLLPPLQIDDRAELFFLFSLLFLFFFFLFSDDDDDDGDGDAK